MDCKGNVFDNDQAVGHSNPGQDEVNGVGPHVLMGEHYDVQHVEDSPHAAHHQGKIPVERKVNILVICV